MEINFLFICIPYAEMTIITDQVFIYEPQMDISKYWLHCVRLDIRGADWRFLISLILSFFTPFLRLSLFCLHIFLYSTVLLIFLYSLFVFAIDDAQFLSIILYSPSCKVFNPIHFPILRLLSITVWCLFISRFIWILIIWYNVME